MKNRRREKGEDSAGTSRAKKERVKVAGWPGYVRNGTFVIEKRIKTIKWHVSTHCTSLRAALKQLEIFESNPRGYNATRSAKPDALVLTEALIEEFRAWHLAPKPDGGGVSRAWALDVRSCLYDWANHLGGSDLRGLSLIDDLKPHLRKYKTQSHHRVKAIRTLFRWLREEKGTITRAQDVTLDLPVPVIAPAQERKAKAQPFELVTEIVPYLREQACSPRRPVRR